MLCKRIKGTGSVKRILIAGHDGILSDSQRTTTKLLLQRLLLLDPDAKLISHEPGTAKATDHDYLIALVSATTEKLGEPPWSLIHEFHMIGKKVIIIYPDGTRAQLHEYTPPPTVQIVMPDTDSSDRQKPVAVPRFIKSTKVRSSDGTHYYTVNLALYSDGKEHYTCDCKGFGFRSMCRHIEVVKAKE